LVIKEFCPPKIQVSNTSDEKLFEQNKAHHSKFGLSLEQLGLDFGEHTKVKQIDFSERVV